MIFMTGFLSSKKVLKNYSIFFPYAQNQLLILEKSIGKLFEYAEYIQTDNRDFSLDDILKAENLAFKG